MIRSHLISTFFVILVLMLSLTQIADCSSLEISNDGRVSISSILSLEPVSSLPADPSEGDIVFTTGKELLIYSNGDWQKISFSQYFSYAWETGTWSDCTANCGGGTQTRFVQCKRSDEAVVADSYCSSAKPIASQACNTQSCVECATNSSSDWLQIECPAVEIRITWNGQFVGTITNSSTTHYDKDGYRYTRGTYRGPYGEGIESCIDVGIPFGDIYNVCRELL